MKSFILFTLSFFINALLFAQHPDLVGAYSFEDGNARDAIEIGGDGIINGTPEVIEGVIGQALFFDGGAHSVVFPGRLNQYLSSTRDFTISFFFRSDDPEKRTRSIMGKRHVCKGINMFDIRVGRSLSVEVYESERRPLIRCNVTTPIPNEQWHHYVFVKRANTSRLYQDGDLVDENSSPYVIGISDLVDFSINGSPCLGIDGTQNMKGAIDELLIYRDNLSSKEIRQLYLFYKKQWDKKLESRSGQRSDSMDKLDPRVEKILGTYRDAQHVFQLNKTSFSLTIFNPVAYPAYQQAKLNGTYRIEAGKLYLLSSEAVLIPNDAEEFGSKQKTIDLAETPIIGDLYGDVVIDFYVLETRLKFRKTLEAND